MASFHQLGRRWIDKANHQPIALALAIDLFGPQYDAIVVDEAQNFGNEFWLPIELLLSDTNQAQLYIFLDENQDIYRRSAAIPIPGEPMVLDRNCRNTSQIHTGAYRYYKGGAVEHSAIAGVDVELMTAKDTASQARAIGRLVTRLIVEEKVKPPLYVGLSRANSLLFLCGTTEVCEGVYRGSS
jgi:superfamily I DNA/RNA helicase